MNDTNPLDPVQRSAREQFAKQSHRYGQGHILENIEDVQAALETISLPEQRLALVARR